jgi:hypothetical protein
VDEQHFANRRRHTADAAVGKVMLVDEGILFDESRCRPKVIRVRVAVGSRRKHRFAMDSPGPDRPAEML